MTGPFKVHKFISFLFSAKKSAKHRSPLLLISKSWATIKAFKGPLKSKNIIEIIIFCCIDGGYLLSYHVVPNCGNKLEHQDETYMRTYKLQIENNPDCYIWSQNVGPFNFWVAVLPTESRSHVQLI